MHCTQNLIETGLLQSAKRIASGGLYFSLLECIWESDCGFEIETDKEVRKDAFLFGESQGRILVSVSPEKEKAFSQKCVEENMYFFKAGIVISGGDLRIDQHNFGRAHEKKEIFDGAFEKYL